MRQLLPADVCEVPLHNSIMRQNESKGVQWPAVVLSLVSLCVIAVVVMALRTAGPLLLDDGYYYLQIAWHISRGDGTTFDGINLTNGFHPLWQFLLVPVFWAGMGKITAEYAATLLQTVFFLFSGWALYWSLWRFSGRGLALVASCVWLLNPWLWNKAAVSGMETGALVAFLGIACWLFIRLLEDNAPSWQLGIALALLTATRIDMLPFSAAAVLAAALLKGPRSALWVAFPTLIYLSIYLTLNTVIFGHPLPVSGYIKAAAGRELMAQFVTSGNLELFIHAWRNISEFCTLGGRLPWLVPVLAASVLPVGAWQLKGNRRVFFLVCVFNVIVYLGYYACMYSSLLSVYTYYFIPAIYTGIMCTFILLTAISRHWVGLVGIAFLVTATTAFSAIYLINRLTLADFTHPRERLPEQMVIEYINHHLPPRSIVGCWDAGEIGYKSNLPVVNLDGVVNSYQYQRMLREEGLANYLAKLDVSYLTSYHVRMRQIIEKELKWELEWEISVEVPPRRSQFSLASGGQNMKQASTQTYYVFRRPSSDQAKDFSSPW